MGNPLVSVAMAAYNGEKYLREQLDSIFHQDYSPIEVIVNDDASTDGTVGILKEYAARYPLKYIVNPRNLGFIGNFTAAIKRCSGDYIALSDQDDVWLPGKISTLVREIGSRSLACSDAELIDENGLTIAESMFAHMNRPVPADDKLRTSLVWGNFVTGCTALFRKELTRNAFPVPDGEKAHDWWLAVRAAYENGIAFVPDALVKYRQHGANTLGVGIKPDKNIFRKIGRKFARLFKDRKTTFNYQYALTQCTRLPVIRDALPLCPSEKDVYNDAIQYYKNYVEHYFHFKTAGMAWKYREFLNIRNRLAWLGSLFG